MKEIKIGKGKLILGNSLDYLKTLDSNSIDTVITDPPYGLSNHSEKIIREVLSKWLNGEEDYVPKLKGFMSKSWDAFVPPPLFWKEVYRVVKPGATILVFAGSRTQDLMSMSLRLAGFEIKDCLMWIYASGFPKATDISKQIDNKLGFQRNKVSIDKGASTKYLSNKGNYRPWMDDENHTVDDDNPISPEAKLWDGYKSHGLKPSYEPLIMAIKSNEKSYADNALKWKVGGLNIDEGRIEYLSEEDRKSAILQGRITTKDSKSGVGAAVGGTNNVELNREKWKQKQKGRFPSNVILECICDKVFTKEGKIIKGKREGGIWKSRGKETEMITYKNDEIIHTNPNCPCYMLDKQSGILNYATKPQKKDTGKTSMFGIGSPKNANPMFYGKQNKGGASRFFYTAKASKSERNLGIDNNLSIHKRWNKSGEFKEIEFKGNIHPTVKPISLIKYLVKLTSMPNKEQIYLDPFIGSGTTAIACEKLSEKWIGIEVDKEYFDIAIQRIKQEARQTKLL